MFRFLDCVPAVASFSAVIFPAHCCWLVFFVSVPGLAGVLAVDASLLLQVSMLASLLLLVSLLLLEFLPFFFSGVHFVPAVLTVEGRLKCSWWSCCCLLLLALCYCIYSIVVVPAIAGVPAISGIPAIWHCC
jgi:hypothetical protein